MKSIALAAVLILTVSCSPSVPEGPARSNDVLPTNPKPRFTDVSAERGLDFFFNDDHTESRRMFETFGGGVVVIDFDGDGAEDLFFPGGGTAVATDAPVTHQGLFKNDGVGFFSDVTVSMGLGDRNGDYATGGVTADIDGDGDLDLFVTCLGRNRLYRNDGDYFSEVADGGGAAGSQWSAGALFFDADGDGDSDLFVVNYVKWDPEDRLPCTLSGVRIYCTPDLFEPSDDRFYLNEGGTFVDATERAGLADLGGKGLAAAAADFDDDGDIDIYVANDTTPNFLLLNDGHGRFLEEAFVRGAALGRNGLEEASMGVAIADLDGDLDADVVVTNFAKEAFNLFRNDGGFFTEVSDREGVLSATWKALGFGVVTPDVDLDGRQDLVFACGHINDLADQLEVGIGYQQPNILLRQGDEGFQPWPETVGDMALPDVSRGLAVADIDSDGDEDLVFQRLGAPAQLLINESRPFADAWIAVRPVDGNRAPAWGASVTLEFANGERLRRWMVAGGSFASSNEPVVRFGLVNRAAPIRLIVDFVGRPAMIVDSPLPGRVHVVQQPG